MNIDRRVLESKVRLRNQRFKAVETDYKGPKRFVGEVDGIVIRVYNNGKLVLENDGIFANIDGDYKDLYEILRKYKVSKIEATFKGRPSIT